MIEFIYHDALQKEIATLERRFKNIKDGLASFERLCQIHFDPINPKQIIAPAKLHRLTQGNNWTLYKIELIIPNSGLRPNQWPRLWFAIQGTVIGLLCIATHVDNYNDENLKRLACARLSDIF